VTTVNPFEVDKLSGLSTKRGIHMNILQRAAEVGAVTAAVVGAMGGIASQAGAATPLAKYNGVCGAGYTVVDSAPVGTAGTVYPTYNPSTGQDCVVTVRDRPGAAVSMLAAVTDAQDVDPEFPLLGTDLRPERRSEQRALHTTDRLSGLTWSSA
jgi:hypothetical protein